MKQGNKNSFRNLILVVEINTKGLRPGWGVNYG